MNLADFIFNRVVRGGASLIRVHGRDEGFHFGTHQIHVVGQSFGDSLRCGAIIKDRIEPGKEQVVFVEYGWPFGLEVISNLNFVDWIVLFPRETWTAIGPSPDFIEGPRFADLPISYHDLTNPYLGVSPDGIPLYYSIYDFDKRFDLPKSPYVVIQPFTRWNKIMDMPSVERTSTRFIDRGISVIALGGGKDPVPSLPGSIVNMIGKLTVAESIWIAANAKAAVGVESWCASFLPMMGKPSIMYCLKSSIALYGARWKLAWPKIHLAEVADDTDSLIERII